MGTFLSLPVLALAAILQVSVMPQITLFGARADLVFLIVMGWSLNSSLDQSIIWAFVGGLAKDLLSAAPLGTSTVGMVIMIFVVSALRRQIFSVGVLTLVWVVVLGTIIQGITTLIILSWAGFGPVVVGRPGIQVYSEIFTVNILPIVVYNLLLVFPTYWVVRRMQTRFDTDKRLFR